MADDPYERLGVPRGAPPDAIRRAYRQRAKRLHPDAGGSADQMASLSAAYSELMRSGKRPTIVRTPRQRRRARSVAAWSATAEQFARVVYRPQARLLELALAPLQDERDGVRLQELAGRASLVLEMVGASLARAEWPEELAGAKHLVGDGLRHLSDALVELQAGEELADARRGLSLGRSCLREASAVMPVLG